MPCAYGCTELKHTTQSGVLAHYNVTHLYTAPRCLQFLGIDQQLLLMYVARSPMMVQDFDNMRELERQVATRNGYPSMPRGFIADDTRLHIQERGSHAIAEPGVYMAEEHLHLGVTMETYMSAKSTLYYDSYRKCGIWARGKFDNPHIKTQFSYIISPMVNSALGDPNFFWAPKLEQAVFRNTTVNVRFGEITRPFGLYLTDDNIHSHFMYFELLNLAGETVHKIAARGYFIEDLCPPQNMYEPAVMPTNLHGVHKAWIKIVPIQYWNIIDMDEACF